MARYAPRSRNRGGSSTPVTFHINGEQHTVNDEYDVTTSLNDYIRDVAGLRGTKVMCKEGGCGCCAVTVTQEDLTSGGESTFSINSCLCPLYNVGGWKITTVEGIGSRKDGYHPIQDRVATFNGSQCGYCTPGMVMNMFGLVNQKGPLSQQEIEDQFDGNICRCTGYRPILDSMKSFATDSTIQAPCVDIEELQKVCPKSGQRCAGRREGSQGECAGSALKVCAGDQVWYRPQTLKDMAGIVMSNGQKKIRLVHGNTASGVYKKDGPFDIYIDLHMIPELSQFQTTETSMQFGANLTLSKLITLLEEKKTQKGYGYFEVIARHLKKIGNVLIRNAGSWAGNVMIKQAHPEFPSDVFTVMEAAGAHITVADISDGSCQSYPLLSLITELDMSNKLIISLELFQQDEKYRLQSYKVMPRSQNAHAYVNAAFQISVDAWKFQVLKKPSLVFGGINKDLIHASKTETLLHGKTLTDGVVLRSALETLASELNPSTEHVLASPEYRRSLAVNLLYKFILEICGAKHLTRTSGPLPIARPVSSGVREYPEKKSDWPLKQPMPKLESHAQASGEAVFITDVPNSPNTLYGAFVVTSQGPATLGNVDPAPALKMPGVVDFVTLDDIPEGGTNSCMAHVYYFPLSPEELFCSGQVLYAGQPIGLILAESQAEADEAAEKVDITYNDVRTPILTLEDAIAQESFFDNGNPQEEKIVGDPETAMKKAAKKLSGDCKCGSCYHFYLENQVTLCVPSEDRLDVYAATQGSELTQGVISQVTGLPMNNITVTVPRVGGSFGGKFFTTLPVAASASLAAYKHSRPVKVAVNLSTNMKMAGKRFPIKAKYDVGFDESGRIQVVSMDIYCDGGFSPNTMMLCFSEITQMIDQGYHIPNWKVRVIACKTDKPASTIMRAPAPLPAGFLIESVLEHVAKHLTRNVLDIKEQNLYKEGQVDLFGNELTYCTIRKLWTELRKWADVDRRQNEVNSFNKANQWKKRGLTMTPTKYGIGYLGYGISADVAIYARDGTITVSQGGVEIGQGLFTKVAQAVAMGLGVPVSVVKVLPNSSHSSANTAGTGGSSTSELAVLSVLSCCEILNERIAPIKEKNPDADWKTLVQLCEKAGLDLTARHKTVPKGLYPYFSYCAGVTEVELDVLTGENQIRRVDILFDCGESLNPEIDIGQIEGSYVMAMGNLLMEDIVYHPESGAVLNDGTWEYKPPTTKDIPVDIRVKLLADAPNPKGIRGSKASGEPPMLLATGAFYALKQAMEAARVDVMNNKDFVPPVAPLTVERLMMGCGVKVDKLVL